ncbi:MAG: TetR/AcrR family transcriptional regulator [Conexibacter sp.]|nr:TetR/AcrR family transcriptional regulator [Conexibacter sp.]
MSLDTRPLRKDAERNRQRILAAAGELFAEAGLHVTLDAVAERAGVGVGTVYRRFPDKEALIDALFEERIDEVVAIAEQACALDDAWDGLVFFFDRAISLHGEDRALKELVFSTAHGRERVAHARGKLKPIVGRLVARAQEAGQLRPDVDITDVPVIQLMLTAVMEYTGDVAPEVWRRYLAILLDGLRAGAALSPLSAAALSDEQLDGAMARGLRPLRR